MHASRPIHRGTLRRLRRRDYRSYSPDDGRRETVRLIAAVIVLALAALRLS